MVSLNCFRNGKEEAVALSDEVEKNLKNKFSLNNIAILVRAIFQTRENLRKDFLKSVCHIELLEVLNFMIEQK